MEIQTLELLLKQNVKKHYRFGLQQKENGKTQS